MIGILGGTFDPVHFGHLRPALEVCEALGLEQLRLIPCRIPPHRRMPVARSEQRATMVERAIAGEPRFVLDRREFFREGPSYSIDTLRSLRGEFGDTVPLCLIMGADAFAGLSSWYEWETLIALAHIVVCQRPGYGVELPDEMRDWAAAHRTETAAELAARPAGCLWYQPVTALDISATQIRDLLAGGRDARFLLPEAVRDYIHEHGLYRPEAADDTVRDDD
jgi:nicotinate-nucleotide adenylyltransferase